MNAEHHLAIDATPERVWDALADFGALAAWVPIVEHSCLLSDQSGGVGAIRRVQIAGRTLVETVVTWSPERELAYSVDGLPPFVDAARNTWRVRPGDGRRSTVSLTTEIDTGRNPLKRFVARKVLERMALASEVMLSALATTLATTDSTAVSATTDEETT